MPTRTPHPAPHHGRERPPLLEMVTITIKNVQFRTKEGNQSCDVSLSVLVDQHLVPFESLKSFAFFLRAAPPIDPQAVGSALIEEVVATTGCRAASCTVKIPLTPDFELTTIHSWERELPLPLVQENAECPADS